MSGTDRTTEPGKRLASFAEALRGDLKDRAEAVDDLADEMESLAREMGGINGLASWARSSAAKLRDEAKAMRERANSYHASLTTTKAPPEITESTDPELAERVKEARGAEAA